MAPRVVFPSPTILIDGVKIDYGLTPKQAVELLPGSNPDIASWPEELMNLWHGGQSGVVESATLPILWPQRSFSTAEGREKQEAAGIGFATPVVIASLALPENEPERVRKELNERGIWWLVALRQSNEELWQLEGAFRPFCLVLGPDYFGFGLRYAGGGWGGDDALVGAPQVS